MTAPFEPLRLGLIGCGGIGWRHILAAMEMQRRGRPPVRYVTLCDADEKRREEIASRLEALSGERPRTVAHWREVLDDPWVEAVDICLPTAFHHVVAIEALLAGRHVQIGKPLALTVRDCDCIVDAARLSGLVVSVAENYRRIPSNRAFAALIASHELGRSDAMFVRNIASATRAMLAGGKQIDAPTWYHDRRIGGGYHSLEMGAHEADLQRVWFGEIKAVNASAGVFGGQEGATTHQGEDVLTATFRFASGFCSHLSFCSAPHGIDLADRLFIGEKGTCSSRAWQEGDLRHSGQQQHIDWHDVVHNYLANLDADTRDRLLPKGSWDEEALLSSPEAPLTYGIGTALFDFARAVREKSRPEVTVEEGRAAVAICWAMLESAHARAEVAVADVLSGRICSASKAFQNFEGMSADDI